MTLRICYTDAKGSVHMRKRIGCILLFTGIMLLVKPNFDMDQIMLAFNYFMANYWPVGLVVVGALLLWPQPKKNIRKRSRT